MSIGTAREHDERECCWVLRNRYDKAVTAAQKWYSKYPHRQKELDIEESRAYQELVQHKRDHNI